MQNTDYNPQATNLAFSEHEISADFEQYPEAAPPAKPQAVADPSYFIPSTCLSLQPPRGRLRNWRLATVRAEVERLTPNHIIGAVVQVDKGRTSPIESIDPATRRVRTTSGSVYELSEPNQAFAQNAPEVLRKLGF